MSGSAAAPPPVRRRHVLYVAGFDPRGASFYHRLFRDEAAHHAALGGEPIEIGPRRKLSALSDGWTIASGFGQDRVETSYEFLRWDDVVRAYWVRGTRDQWLKTLRSSWFTVTSGLWKRTLRASYPFSLTMLLPAIAIVGRFLAILLAAAIFACAIPAVFGMPWWSGIPIVALLGWWAHRKAGQIEAKWNIPWIGQIVMFTVRDSKSGVPEMDERREVLADMFLAAAHDDTVDEVLLVGHSHGVALAVTVMARALLKDPELGRRHARVSLLTLGSTALCLGWLPGAAFFRRDLLMLGSSQGVAWIDFTAPPDGACYALVDPVIACNPDFVRPAEDGPCPKLLNARMLDLLDPATYQSVKQDRMRVHFQYLMAGDKLGDYDYYKIVSGPLTLADRYRDRPSVTNFSRLRLFAK